MLKSSLFAAVAGRPGDIGRLRRGGLAVVALHPDLDV